MKRVLVIAYYFPPVAAAGSFRVAGLARHLPQNGWEPIVVAPTKTPHAQDPGLEFPEELVRRSRSIELSRAGRAIRAGSSSSRAAQELGSTRERLGAALRGFAHRWVYYPDAQIGWYPGAVRSGLRALREQRFDAVWSSSFPITAHLVARKLSRSAGIPWIAEFRDPWSDTLAPDHPNRRRAARLEQVIADEAAAVVMPTRAWAELYGERWGVDVDVVSNGFDALAPPADPERVITHIGSYYPGRQDYSALWRVLAWLRERGEAPRLRIAGDLTGSLADEVRGAGIADLVDVTGYVPHDQIGQLVQSSSSLVASAFVGDDPVQNGVVPAKLFDYLATERPILYLSRPHTEGARLLDGQDGCSVVDPDDDAAIEAAVVQALANPVSKRDPERWSRAAASRALAMTLDRSTRGGA